MRPVYINVPMSNGKEMAIIVRPETIARLATTCFRGPEQRLAGNFSRWRNVRELFSDTLVMEKFIEEVEALHYRDNATTRASLIDHTRHVGWASTSRVDDFIPSELEPFKPNKRSRALRVRPETNRLAPRVRELTIVYEFKFERSTPTAVVHSIYPGEDVGELLGNVSRLRGVVFFDWNHPGA